MAGKYGDLDYSKLTKQSFLLGIGLFAIGGLGEIIINAGGISVPAWEHTLLVDAEMLGIVIALLSPFVFGLVLPLTE